MKIPLDFPVESILPHAGGMVLIDRVIDYGDEYLIAGVSINEETMFLEGGEVPAWVGIEYMAQSIAAYAGLQAKANGEPVKPGFLLGTRCFEANVTGFKKGSELTVSVKELCRDERGLGVFQCLITSGRVEVKANVNVYQPNNLEAFINEMVVDPG